MARALQAGKAKEAAVALSLRLRYCGLIRALCAALSRY
jgi:hypothetical protein